MKLGLEVGLTASLTITVDSDMFASFNGVIVHRAYSTVSMVYHMEWASRLLILPFLEDMEEGMGAEVSVKHIAPCCEGDQLTIKAILHEVDGNKVFTKTEVIRNDLLVGIGEVKQVILPKEKIHQLLQKPS
ncbi:thioesterase family protein [Bacillus sp. DJP31]|uniref:thioesterase family protein n=1 Tax=Bacillus sp. DJP31 TaxID=3409789 RepID=UPI003BB65F02